KLIQSLSPSAVQFMHQESRRAFPAIDFENDGMPIFDCRVHALSELLSCGALKNRNVIDQGSGQGVVVLYQWTELGLRMLLALHAIDATRAIELRNQIKSVPDDTFPPAELRTFPAPAQQPSPPSSDVQVPTTDKAVTEELAIRARLDRRTES